MYLNIMPYSCIKSKIKALFVFPNFKVRVILSMITTQTDRIPSAMQKTPENHVFTRYGKDVL